MVKAPTIGIIYAVLAAVALAVQGLAVRRASRASTLADVVALVFLVNALVLIPLTVIVHAPAFGLTGTAVAWFAIGGLTG